ncbi:MAG: ThuA domain-containing protein [Oscillospiraceae bacterium]|jgi:trehalose utilization protein|nr:ThuA domain-containing protein [Oscillospiraceae bacterium]
MLKVTIWNEFLHEKTDERAKALYPEGIHEHLAKVLQAPDLEIRTAYLDQDEDHGLGGDVLDSTDVLLWWGHMAHNKVKDEVAAKVRKRVREGMGFVPMHSAHMSKAFVGLMGTACTLQWREIGEKARIWCVNPGHPIAQGVPLTFPLESEEMYGEVFHIPAPDELLFITWWQGGNVFRGGCTFRRGLGKIFYFHPGHETCPSFHNENVLKILSNAIRWAAPAEPRDFRAGDWVEPLEEFRPEKLR